MRHQCIMPVHQHKTYTRKCMASINRAFLCLVKDAIEKELGEPSQTNLSILFNPMQPNMQVLRLSCCS